MTITTKNLDIIECDLAYAPQILEILNEAIANSTALYDYEPRTIGSMTTWFELKTQHNFPVLGIVNHNNELIAFGTYGKFRAFPAFKYSIENSLYVKQGDRGKGLGTLLLAELIKWAEAQNYHCMIAGIDSANLASIALHRQFGFQLCGEIQQVGFKFGRWLDLHFYQLLLATPRNPTDGLAK